MNFASFAELKRKAINEGVYAFLPKPVLISKLMDAVDSVAIETAVGKSQLFQRT